MRSFKTPIETLFEDDHLLVINKPSGLPSHATPDKNRPHLLSALKEKSPSLVLLHRLDADTSGLLILSKTAEANLNLQAQLKNREIKKIYWTVSENLSDASLSAKLKSLRQQILQSGEAVLFKNHLSYVKQNRKEIAAPVHSGGNAAVSLFRCLNQDPKWITFEVELITGRKHQIRSHLKSLNWPILGDSLYNESQRVKAPRLALHSWKLKLRHPISEVYLELEASRPEEFSLYF